MNVRVGRPITERQTSIYLPSVSNQQIVHTCPTTPSLPISTSPGLDVVHIDRHNEPIENTSFTRQSSVDTVSMASSQASDRLAPCLPSASLESDHTFLEPSRYLKSFLDRNGWHVDESQNIIICLQCNSIINPADVRGHVMKHHKDVRPDRLLQVQFDQTVKSRYPHLTWKPARPTTAVPQIAGLQMLESCQICSICSRGFGIDVDRGAEKESRSFKKHICQKGVENLSRSFSIGPAQRFMSHLSWFPVFQKDPVASTKATPWTLYRSAMSAREECPMMVSIPEDYRVLNQFLHKERWLDHVKGLEVKFAIEATAYSTKDKMFSGLHRRIHAFLALVQSRIHSYTLRRFIGTRPASEHAHTYQRHHSDVNFETHRTYSFILAACISLLIRSIKSPSAEYPFPMASDVKKAGKEFHAAFMRLGPPTTSGSYDDDGPLGEVADSDDEDDYPDDEPLPDPAIDPNLLEDKDACDATIGMSFSYSVTDKRHVPKFQDEAQTKLLALLHVLYTQKPNDAHDNPFRSVFVRYLVLSSLRYDGGWITASNITQKIAAILHAGRLVMASIMLALKAKSPQLSYAQ